MAEHLAATSRLVTDGLRCWTAATEAGLEHKAIVTGSGRRAAGWSPFNWVNTTLGNVKAITGTYRSLSPEHAGRYLASFAWRFNRRFQLATLIPRLVHSAVRTKPLPTTSSSQADFPGYSGTAMPAASPPPPICTNTASIGSGCWRRISIPTVPWPAITSGSS